VEEEPFEGIDEADMRRRRYASVYLFGFRNLPPRYVLGREGGDSMYIGVGLLGLILLVVLLVILL